jgi:hypothetical protein
MPTIPVFLRIKYGDVMKIKVVYKEHELHVDEEKSETTLKYDSKLVIELIKVFVLGIDGLVSEKDKK